MCCNSALVEAFQHGNPELGEMDVVFLECCLLLAARGSFLPVLLLQASTTDSMLLTQLLHPFSVLGVMRARHCSYHWQDMQLHEAGQAEMAAAVPGVSGLPSLAPGRCEGVGQSVLVLVTPAPLLNFYNSGRWSTSTRAPQR